MRHKFIRRAAPVLGAILAALGAIAEEPAPNCFVVVDRKGVETEFFGAVMDMTLDTKTGTHTVIATEHTPDYDADFIWSIKDIKEIRNEYRKFNAGIDAVEADAETGTDIVYADGGITVRGARAGAVLRIFDMRGRQVASKELTMEKAALSVASLGSGIYVAEIDGVTLKIVKK